MADKDPTQTSPLISVVIPVFKGSDKLPSTLGSLLSEPLDLWEAIVRDGSPDSAPGQAAVDTFLREHPDTRVKFIGGPDKGVYDAMNQGIDASTGQFFYFLGAGDRVLEGAFTKMAPILTETAAQNEMFVVYGTWLLADGSSAGHEFTWMDFARKKNINHQAMLFSRSLFEKIGKYDIRYPIRADNIYNIRLWANPSVSRKFIPLVITRFEGGGLSDTKVDVQFHEDFDKVIAESFGVKGTLIAKLVDLKVKLTGRK